jgi:transcription antitermination factor NusG
MVDMRDDGPQDSSPEIFSLQENWHVLQTKSRQEKALAADLVAMKIAHFLPLRRSTRTYGRRKQVNDLPLFSGYLFLRGSLDDAYLADRTGRVAKIIAVPDQGTLDWELRNLKKALDTGVELDPYPYIRAGAMVEVKSGPMRGLQGFVENRTAGERIIIRIQTLGQAVSMEIDGALLEAL